MRTHWIDERIVYDGSQLRSHWILHRCGVSGDALVAFRGPCAVAATEMADLADLDGPGIAADDMVHFVWEAFDHPDLLLAVHRQRLLSATPVSSLIHFAVNATPGGAPVPIATLAELGIEPRGFAAALLGRAGDEQHSIAAARAKVRPKGEWR